MNSLKPLLDYARNTPAETDGRVLLPRAFELVLYDAWAKIPSNVKSALFEYGVDTIVSIDGVDVRWG